MSEAPQDESLFRRWRAGDEQAARLIFERYVDRLLALARGRLGPRLARRVDPEDIVQSVFRTFFARARAGQFHVGDRDDLCKLLVRITLLKTLRQVAFHTAAKRDVAQEDAGAADGGRGHLLEVLDRGPTPEAAAAFIDQLGHFLDELRPAERQIIDLRLQGHKDVEIAERLGVSDRKIRRLMERVRGLAAADDWLPAG
jgi:RNA polymerase sigma-70 factor (ECF subfamily)